METLARPYARAAFMAAHAEDALDAWMTFLHAAALCMGEAALAAYLASPAVPRATKRATLLQLLRTSGIQLSKTQQNFLSLLLANNQLSRLQSIVDLFKRMKLHSENKIIALVRTAFALTAQEQTELERTLSQLRNQPVLAEVQLDESLIGGLVVEIQGRSWDYSVRGKLNQLRKGL